MQLIDMAALTRTDVERIWSLSECGPALGGAVAWSFEGNGIRTRTTFIQAFRELGLAYTELPNLLKSAERVEDLAAYLDPFYSHYVVRESNHQRLAAFARASRRPVINAMSSNGHPCEVLTDAYFVDRSVKRLSEACVCLWGPTTNVFRSWHELAKVMGVRVIQVCDEAHRLPISEVRFQSHLPQQVDVVITDAWPAHADGPQRSLTLDDLSHMEQPALLPTPPFTIGAELAFDPTHYSGFVGYAQKELLLPMHKGILRWVSEAT
jgi:ornithine carbamoyltransferase